MRGGCAPGLQRRGGPPDRDECWEETPVPVEGVLDLELGLEVRSVSDMMAAAGGWGDREGRELCDDICEPERDDEGNDDSDVLLAGPAPPPFEYVRLLVLLLTVRFRYGGAAWADAIADPPLRSCCCLRATPPARRR